MYLFFDTETTGLPKNWNAPVTDTENWPRIIQLAFARFDSDGNLIESFCKLIKPNGWVMPTDKFWTDHGYSQEKSEAEGIEILEALKHFHLAINESQFLVAHNMSFDEKIVGCEFIRSGSPAVNKLPKLCTMRSSTDLCKIPGPYGFKWPKLEELHRFLFKADFYGAHDALNDVMACAKCFFELKRLNITIK